MRRAPPTAPVPRDESPARLPRKPAVPVARGKSEKTRGALGEETGGYMGYDGFIGVSLGVKTIVNHRG